MGYWPDVNPGDTFQPNAKLENEIRHRLNALNGFGTGGISAGKTSLIRIPVYNPSTTNTLPDGKAVSIDLTGTIARDCYPVVPYDDDLPCYGVLIQPLPPKGIGDCTLSGLAVVSISGIAADGNFAKPDEAADGAFVRTEKGVRIINVTGTKAVVILGEMTSEYKAGNGINSDLITGGMISLNLIGVDGCTVSPVVGSTNGLMQVSYSGGVPPGTVIAYAGGLNLPGSIILPSFGENADVPDGWLLCDGHSELIADYPALFAAIGTIYGGDGETSFCVPDYRGSFLRGAEQPQAFGVVGVAVTEDDETGEYVNAGYVDLNGMKIEYGEAVIDGDTVSLSGATVFPSCIVVGGTSYPLGDVEINGVIEADGYEIRGFLPVFDVGAEGQEYLGKLLHQQLPNIQGLFLGVKYDKLITSQRYFYEGDIYESSTISVSYPTDGVFMEREPNEDTGLIAFPVGPKYYSGINLHGINPGDGDREFNLNNISITGGTNRYGDQVYSAGASVTMLEFNSYYSQHFDMVGDNVITVGDYIKQYGDVPPDEYLTFRNDHNRGYVLPTRHVVHWLIKY